MLFAVRVASVVSLILSIIASADQSRAADIVPTVEFCDGTVFRFATLEEGRELIGTADDWVRSFGPFDFQVRLDSKEPVSENEFLEFARAQVVDWDDAEIATMTEVVAGMRDKVAELNLHLNLPDEILLVQTTGHEEGDMGGYTRDEFIVVPEARLSAAASQIEELMLHELFHVMTRHDPDVRKRLYAIIGFTFGGTLSYPKELIARKITNPDAYHFDSFIELEAGGESVKVTPLTLSKSETYAGGGIMGNLAIEFLRVEVKDGAMEPMRANDELILYKMNEVQGYFEKIGKNTFYIIHPEEIMADNFSMAVRQVKGIANPEIFDEVVAVLSGRE